MHAQKQIFIRDKEHNGIYQKNEKNLLQRQNIQPQISYRFLPA